MRVGWANKKVLNSQDQTVCYHSNTRLNALPITVYTRSALGYSYSS